MADHSIHTDLLHRQTKRPCRETWCTPYRGDELRLQPVFDTLILKQITFGLKGKFSLNGTRTVLWKLPPFHLFLHTLTERIRRIPSSLIPLNRDCRDATFQISTSTSMAVSNVGVCFSCICSTSEADCCTFERFGYRSITIVSRYSPYPN